MASGTGGIIVPSSQQPIVGAGGLVTSPWQRFFNALVSGAAPFVTVTVGASPFDYTASQTGTLVISGGTVSSITLTRSGSTVTWPTNAVPMTNGDVTEITYSVPPTVNFVPS